LRLRSTFEERRAEPESMSSVPTAATSQPGCSEVSEFEVPGWAISRL